MAYQDPNFDKEVYWDRRRKGYSGQIQQPGTKGFEREQRRLARKLHHEHLESLKGDKKRERKNRKAVA